MMDEYLCLVCGDEIAELDELDFNRCCEMRQGVSLPLSGISVEYVRCKNCGFSFAPMFQQWSPVEFSSHIYNDDYVHVDPDYVEARPRSNAVLLKQLFGASNTLIRHLDYGGGNGLLSQLLSETGWDSTNCDPYAAGAMTVSGKFNLITAFEVFEHVVAPQDLVSELSGLLADDGLIFFSTLISDDHISVGKPLDWWYAAPRNGHISLFSRKSLQFLAQSAGLQYLGFSENLHVFWKTAPAWASNLLGERCHVPQIVPQKNNMNILNSEFNKLIQSRYGPLIYNRFDKYVGGSLAAYGEFSEGESAMFAQLVTTGQVVIEAGANIGAHTIHLAKLVGEQGAVFAFEPQRIVFQTLCANLALNQLVNVVARQQGVGRQLGEMVLPNVDPRVENNFGGLSLLSEGAGEKVGIVTIDSLGLSRCDLIKVDVEGMEEEVVAGAVNTISKFRPLMYLENDRAEKSASLIRYLQSLNYRIWWHLSPLFNPNNFAKNSENIFGGTVSINILCQPAESARPVAGLREVLDANDTWNQ